MISSGIRVGQALGVAPPRKALTAAQRRALDRATAEVTQAEAALKRARAGWVKVAKGLPQAGVARHLKISPQAVSRRLKGAK